MNPSQSLSRGSRLALGMALATSLTLLCALGTGFTSRRAALPPELIEMVSVTSTYGQGDSHSEESSISADGRYVAFNSRANNFNLGDTNGRADVYVFDRVELVTTLVSVTSAGGLGTHHSEDPSISADGRYVAFESRAPNLVAGDTNGVSDIFIRDRLSGITSRVSTATGGLQANGASTDVAISSDGTIVSFTSAATNLVPGDTNGVDDIFVHDTKTGTTFRVSVSSGGGESNGGSGFSSISGDGSRVAFQSSATNLVLSDTNGQLDAFLRDTAAGVTRLVSASSSGVVGNGPSYSPWTARDGQSVAFGSGATNLVPGDTNGVQDIFVHELDSQATHRVSMTPLQGQPNGDCYSPSLNADGRIVSYMTAATNYVIPDVNGTYTDIYVFDRDKLTTTLVSQSSDGVQAGFYSSDATLTDSGDIISFDSPASDLVASDTNSAVDVFVRDVSQSTTDRVSVTGRYSYAASGASMGSISADGSQVAFRTNSWNIALGGPPGGIFQIAVHGIPQETTEIVSLNSAGQMATSDAEWPSISADGRFVAFQTSAQNFAQSLGVQIYVRDRLLNETTMVSVNTGGVPANDYATRCSISNDGRYVAFMSDADNLAPGVGEFDSNIFLRDRTSATTIRVSVPMFGNQADASYPAISGNGRFVVFVAGSPDMVPGDTNNMPDIFVRDVVLGTTELISVSSSAGQSNGWSFSPDISDDGRYVTFVSQGNNLVPGDSNGEDDVFIRDRVLGTTVCVSKGAGGIGNDRSLSPSVSGDGRFVSFHSLATNLVPDDLNDSPDVFVYDTDLGSLVIASRASDGSHPSGFSESSSISTAGRVAFSSSARLVPVMGTSSYIFARTFADVTSASGYQQVRGTHVLGNVSSVSASDNQWLAYRPGIILSSFLPPISLVFTGQTFVEELESVTVKLESRATSGGVRQTIHAFDFGSGSFVLIDARNCTTTDTVSTVRLSDPERFVGPGGEVRIRVDYRLSAPVLSHPWQVYLDHVQWVIT